jgi:anaerobic selenocysteine-containing dehydrogenase
LIAEGLARGESGLTMDDLLAAPHGLDLGPLRPSLLHRLQTANGRIQAAPPPLMAELQRLAAELGSPARASLTLIGRRDLRSNNSWMHNAPRLVKGKPRHQLLMHPQDLATRQLVSGARVHVQSRVGSIETDVLACDALMPGVACLPHGFGHGEGRTRQARAAQVPGASYNDLTDPQDLDGACFNAALNGLEIEVHPA